MMFHTLAMDFKDQNGDLNPASGIGIGNERAYIDNVGYKADDESVTVPLNSTISTRLTSRKAPACMDRKPW